MNGKLEGLLVGNLAAPEIADYGAIPQDEDAVADREQLGVLRGDDDDRLPVISQGTDHVEDLGLGADIDAGGRLVKDEDVGLSAEPLGDDDLLLVAAGEQPDRSTRVGGLDGEPLDQAR